MRRVVLQMIIAGSLLYATGVAVLANLPAWKHLPGLPISISAVSCPSGPAALDSDPSLLIPLVVAQQYSRGVESPASAESCRRIVELVRDSEPLYNYVPERFICRSIRGHAHEMWDDADLWTGPYLWIIDGQIFGSGTPGFAEVLTAAGLRYTEIDGRVRITAT